MTTNAKLALFLALSFLSGLFEIGVIIWGRDGRPDLVLAFLLALAYQLGALVSFRAPGRASWWGLLLATAVLGVAHLAGEAVGTAWMFVLVTLASALINLSRAALGKAEISTTLKRCSRVLGFLAAPAMLLPAVPGVAVLAAVVLSLGPVSLAEPAREAAASGPPSSRGTAIKWALVTHQMHYFSYCTVVIVTLLQRHSAIIAVSLFILGWASYIAVPHLIGNRWEPGQTALWGHLLLPLVLVGLWITPSAGPLWSLLWIATGFFGGTVVYLTRFSRERYGLNEGQLALLENTGHCLGAGLALAVVCAHWSSHHLFVVGAAFAATTAALIATCLKSSGQFARTSLPSRS